MLLAYNARVNLSSDRCSQQKKKTTDELEMNSAPLSVLRTLNLTYIKHLIYGQLAQVAHLMCQVASSFMSESREMVDK